MLLNPAIIALFSVSTMIALMLLLAAVFALQILRRWDINSGSERQLRLERRTYLISTLLTWVFAFEMVSLLLFVYNAESMSGQFVGAMCATGVLNVNAWGWPTLLLKIAVFFLGAAWLALNYLDNKGYDYPLVRIKYALLLLILPLAVAEMVVQSTYFLNMQPDVITSCCGSLFSDQAQGVGNEVSSLQPATALVLLYGSGLAVMLSGTWFLWRHNGNWLFALSSIVAFAAAIVAIISLVSPYIYEHPNHHCPFCILKSGHDFAGYTLYIPLFLATAMALASASIAPWRHIESLSEEIAVSAPRFTYIALSMFCVFYALTAYWILQSNLTMEGVWW
jgi:hypothetical protein